MKSAPIVQQVRRPRGIAVAPKQVVQLLICWAVLVITSCPSFARQNADSLRRVDLSADIINSSLVDGRRINRLQGNVVLVEDSTTLRARLATEYVGDNLIVFTGDVSIVEETDTLTADVVRYERRQKIGEASGRVLLTDGDVRVSGPVARYDTDRRYAWFEDGVTLVDSSAALTSRLGEYWSREKRALFREGVRLDNRGTITTADSVEYFRDTEIAIGRGSVTVMRFDTTAVERDTVAVQRDQLATPSDSTALPSDSIATPRQGPDELDVVAGDTLDYTVAQTWLFTESLLTDRDGSRFSATGNALLVRIKSPDGLSGESADTMAVAARKIVAHDADSVETVSALGSVRIWRDAVSAAADSAYMTRSTRSGERLEWVRLYRDPILWYGGTQLTGDSIRVLLRNGDIDSLLINGRAFLAREDSILNRIQQVEGEALVGSFSGGYASLVVGPDAHAAYFLEDAGSPNGVMRMAASTIKFVLNDDTLQSIRAGQDIDATYYDEEIVPPGFGLDALDWRPEERPTRDLFALDPRALAFR